MGSESSLPFFAFIFLNYHPATFGYCYLSPNGMLWSSVARFHKEGLWNTAVALQVWTADPASVRSWVTWSQLFNNDICFLTSEETGIWIGLLATLAPWKRDWREKDRIIWSRNWILTVRAEVGRKPSIKLKTWYHGEHVEIRKCIRGNAQKVFDKSNREVGLEKFLMVCVCFIRKSNLRVGLMGKKRRW